MHQIQIISSTTTTKHLDVSSYFYKRLCAVPRFTKETVIYRGPDSSMYFIQSLLKEAEEIQEILKHIQPLEMTEDDLLDFAHATHCFISEKLFEKNENNTLCHSHISGQYRGRGAHAVFVTLCFRFLNLSQLFFMA